mgnify:CR=1 FL=1
MLTLHQTSGSSGASAAAGADNTPHDTMRLPRAYDYSAINFKYEGGMRTPSQHISARTRSLTGRCGCCIACGRQLASSSTLHSDEAAGQAHRRIAQLDRLQILLLFLFQSAPSEVDTGVTERPAADDETDAILLIQTPSANGSTAALHTKIRELHAASTPGLSRSSGRVSACGIRLVVHVEGAIALAAREAIIHRYQATDS